MKTRLQRSVSVPAAILLGVVASLVPVTQASAADATVSTWAELETAVASSGIVTLAADITGNSTLSIAAGVTIDLGSFDLSIHPATGAAMSVTGSLTVTGTSGTLTARGANGAPGAAGTPGAPGGNGAQGPTGTTGAHATGAGENGGTGGPGGTGTIGDPGGVGGAGDSGGSGAPAVVGDLVLRGGNIALTGGDGAAGARGGNGGVGGQGGAGGRGGQGGDAADGRGGNGGTGGQGGRGGNGGNGGVGGNGGDGAEPVAGTLTAENGTLVLASGSAGAAGAGGLGVAPGFGGSPGSGGFPGSGSAGFGNGGGSGVTGPPGNGGANGISGLAGLVHAVASPVLTGTDWAVSDTPTLFTATASPAVTFDTGGGSAVATQNPSYGTPATAPIEPTRSGYTFSGWHVGSATGPAWDETAAVFGPITVFASWTAVGGGGSGGQGTDHAQRLAATGSAGGSALVHHAALAGGLLLAAGALVLVRGRSRAAAQR